MVRILFDSGTTGSFVEAQLTKKLRVKMTKMSSWMTGNGSIATNQKVTTDLILPELYHEHVIQHTFHVIPSDTRCSTALSAPEYFDGGLVVQVHFSSWCG